MPPWSDVLCAIPGIPSILGPDSPHPRTLTRQIRVRKPAPRRRPYQPVHPLNRPCRERSDSQPGLGTEGQTDLTVATLLSAHATVMDQIKLLLPLHCFLATNNLIPNECPMRHFPHTVKIPSENYGVDFERRIERSSRDQPFQVHYQSVRLSACGRKYQPTRSSARAGSNPGPATVVSSRAFSNQRHNKPRIGGRLTHWARIPRPDTAAGRRHSVASEGNPALPF